jgi:hypothetical protein
MGMVLMDMDRFLTDILMEITAIPMGILMEMEIPVPEAPITRAVFLMGI